MKIRIDIGKDLYKLHMQLEDFKRKQLPFALAKALNNLALTAKGIIQEEYQETLQIRNKGLLKKGIQVNFANKSDFPYMASEVGIIDGFGFLSDHVFGHLRVARSALGRAIPKAINRSASGKIASSKKPKALLSKKNTFIMKADSGKRMIVSRVGKDRLPVKVLYSLTTKAEIKKTVNLEPKVSAMISSQFDMELSKQLWIAVKSAK